MSKYSIVVLVSDIDVFNNCLLKSLTSVRGDHDIEIIPIVNTNNLYSASVALNIGIDVSKSDIIIFIHQDVTLLDDWFTKLDAYIDCIDGEWGIIGAAGIDLRYNRNHISKWGGTLNDKIIVGSVWHSADELNNTPYWNGSAELTKVHCVDECVFVLNKTTGLRFDISFDGFHFYGTDICLQSRSAAFPVFCANLPIVHHSKYNSSLIGNNKYWPHLRLLHSKWRSQFPELLGTHFHWNNTDHKTSELVSYINFELSSIDNISVSVRSVSLNRVQLRSDRQRGIIGHQ